VIVELLTNQPFEEFVYDNVYRPLALDSITYQPLKKFPRSLIAPTEDDQDFRKQLLQGDVHDPGAAMLGGIAGHAGLFGNAHQVAQLMQMFLNKGSLNGVKIFEPQTLNYFTRTHFKNNRRGLGFDKPPLDPKETSRSMAKSASPESFGHTGFTGTFVWADPKNKLVVVFLSNRVYPNAKTNLLAKMSIRPQIHELFYQYVQQIQKK
jgi:CubicO group peptidase (beta-lactamase class C family)